jgi:hypothetical protein
MHSSYETPVNVFCNYEDKLSGDKTYLTNKFFTDFVSYVA